MSPYNHISQTLRDSESVSLCILISPSSLFMKNWANKGAIISVIVVKEQDNGWCPNGCKGLRQTVKAYHFSIHFAKVLLPCHSVLKELRPPAPVFWLGGTVISLFSQWNGWKEWCNWGTQNNPYTGDKQDANWSELNLEKTCWPRPPLPKDSKGRKHTFDSGCFETDFRFEEPN